MKKKVVFVAADLSNNCLGRIWILADMAAPEYDVEIIGHASRSGVWEPLKNNHKHTITTVQSQTSHWRSFLPLVKALRHTSADIVYICKPRLHTLLAAFLTCKNKRLAIDIDDWETGLTMIKSQDNNGSRLLLPFKVLHTRIAERLAQFIKLRSVSNRFLQARFGGSIIEHARNADDFTALDASGIIAVRGEFGLPAQKKLVMFLGTPHLYKGVPELIDGVSQARQKHPELHLVIAGLSRTHKQYDAYVESVNAKLGKCFTLLPIINWSDHGRLLSCVDIVVVPQRQTPFTRWGQTPSKIFDAMAAGKPLVVSDISDTRDIVTDTAWLVPPDQADAIASALIDICESPAKALARAEKSKERFMEHYSYQAVRTKLQSLLSQAG